jgi:PEGA domain
MRIASVLLIACCVGGCATMAAYEQQVSVTSDPAGANVTIGGISGSTPMSATLPTGYSIPGNFQIYKDGYQPQTVSVQKGFRTSALLQDIFPGVFLGFLPLFIDAITGDWWYVANTSYHVRMHALAGSNTGEKGHATPTSSGTTMERK